MYKTKGLKNGRIEVADALRGLAVIGIILYHSVEHFNVFGPPATYALACDRTVFKVLNILLSGKMYGIFAVLFGLSFFIMRDNQEQKGNDFSLRFAWRMVLLFVLGAINTCLYDGDILTTYALLGFLMIPAGYLSTPVLAVITGFLLIQPTEIYSALTGWTPDVSWVNGNYGLMGDAHINGSFIDGVVANARYGFVTTMGWFILVGRLTQTLGLFYLGIIFGRLRFFYDEGNNLRTWTIILAASAVLVFAGSFVDFGSWSKVLKPMHNLCILMLIMSAFVLLWYKVAGIMKALSKICFFGRMSLTNYLLQSVLGSTLFYGFGLSLCTKLGTTWSALVGVLIIAIQFTLLYFWSLKHQRGPLETIWRKLTWIW